MASISIVIQDDTGTTVQVERESAVPREIRDMGNLWHEVMQEVKERTGIQ